MERQCPDRPNKPENGQSTDLQVDRGHTQVERGQTWVDREQSRVDRGQTQVDRGQTWVDRGQTWVDRGQTWVDRAQILKWTEESGQWIRGQSEKTVDQMRWTIMEETTSHGKWRSAVSTINSLRLAHTRGQCCSHFSQKIKSGLQKANLASCRSNSVKLVCLHSTSYRDSLQIVHSATLWLMCDVGETSPCWLNEKNYPNKKWNQTVSAIRYGIVNLVRSLCNQLFPCKHFKECVAGIICSRDLCPRVCHP